MLHRFLFEEINGAGNGTRTRDLLITNQLLYQLSYTGLNNCRDNRKQKYYKINGFSATNENGFNEAFNN
jgi:hypothetical protein